MNGQENEIMVLAKQASKEWLKELPTPWETANQVPRRYLEIFAKLVAAKKQEQCAQFCEEQYEFYGYDHVFAAGIRALK